MAKSGRQPN